MNMAKDFTIISDLVKKLEIEDSNLIIVEDADDTKYSTINELKKCFSGDHKEPSNATFYSSKKVEDITDNLRRDLSRLASKDEIKSISQRLQDIIAENGSGKDSEIIDARDGEVTLSARFERDQINNEDKYMKKVRKVAEGTQVSTGNEGFVDIYFKNVTTNFDLYLKSKNILDITENVDTDQVDYTDTGFVYSQKDDSVLYVFKITNFNT